MVQVSNLGCSGYYISLLKRYNFSFEVYHMFFCFKGRRSCLCLKVTNLEIIIAFVKLPNGFKCWSMLPFRVPEYRTIEGKSWYVSIKPLEPFIWLSYMPSYDLSSITNRAFNKQVSSFHLSFFPRSTSQTASKKIWKRKNKCHHNMLRECNVKQREFTRGAKIVISHTILHAPIFQNLDTNKCVW